MESSMEKANGGHDHRGGPCGSCCPHTQVSCPSRAALRGALFPPPFFPLPALLAGCPLPKPWCALTGPPGLSCPVLPLPHSLMLGSSPAPCVLPGSSLRASFPFSTGSQTLRGGEGALEKSQLLFLLLLPLRSVGRDTERGFCGHTLSILINNYYQLLVIKPLPHALPPNKQGF